MEGALQGAVMEEVAGPMPSRPREDAVKRRNRPVFLQRTPGTVPHLSGPSCLGAEVGGTQDVLPSCPGHFPSLRRLVPAVWKALCADTAWNAVVVRGLANPPPAHTHCSSRQGMPSKPLSLEVSGACD